MIALSREPRTRRPDFEFTILEWNGLPRGAMRINPMTSLEKESVDRVVACKT
jgi:hypothetical protein